MTDHTKETTMDDLQKLLDEATPGPWSVDARITQNDGSACVYVSGGAWISFARVWVRMEGKDSDTPEGLANARLIAMAPGLAAALILAKEALEQADADLNAMGFSSREVARPLITLARKAINKQTEGAKPFTERPR